MRLDRSNRNQDREHMQRDERSRILREVKRCGFVRVRIALPATMSD